MTKLSQREINLHLRNLEEYLPYPKPGKDYGYQLKVFSKTALKGIRESHQDRSYVTFVRFIATPILMGASLSLLALGLYDDQARSMAAVGMTTGAMAAALEWVHTVMQRNVVKESND